MARETEECWCWVEKELGKGSFGNVFLLTCSQPPHGALSKYALKVVEEEVGYGGGSLSSKERAEAHKELRIMRGLYHPHIVTLVDSFQLAHRLLLVLELCEAGDLRHHLDSLKEKRGSSNMGVQETVALQWTLQLTDGLQYLHHKKILHRDLKPQNIFLKDQFNIKIGDLGIARQLVYTREMAATHIGTPLYISPEIYQGLQYSYKTDVWSLGCCVYEMMTLQYAFHAPSRYELVGKVVNKQVVPLPEEYSSSLRNLVLCMLCKDPDQRPAAKQLMAAVQELHTEQTPPQRRLSGSSSKGDSTLERSERPSDPTALQTWRLRTAEALSHYLNEKQALQCAQITAALQQKLTVDSIRDIDGSPQRRPLVGQQGRRRVADRSTDSTQEEVVDGGGSAFSSQSERTFIDLGNSQGTLTQSGNSDENTLTQSTLCSDMTLSSDNMQSDESGGSGGVETNKDDSHSITGARRDREVLRNRPQPENPSAQRTGPGRKTRVCDDGDSSNRGDETEGSPSRNRPPPRRLKIGKSSMLVPARPLPQPKMTRDVKNSPKLRDPSDSESHSSSPRYKNSVLETGGSLSGSAISINGPTNAPQPVENGEDRNVAYANEVLQYARARLLPDGADGRGGRRDMAYRNGGSRAPPLSSGREGVTKNELRTKNGEKKEEKRGRSVTSLQVKGSNTATRRVTDTEGSVRERSEETVERPSQTDGPIHRESRASHLAAPTQVAASQDKGKKKKRNFLKDRKAKETQSKGTERQEERTAEEEGRQHDGLAGGRTVDEPIADERTEQGVRLFTRAQRVTFMSLVSDGNGDDMDLSIGGESYS